MKPKEETTEAQILNAARSVFIAKGLECARMQEIADTAGINKALLHYYFRSKDKLFEAVFNDIASNLFPAMQQLLDSELGIKEKLTFFVKIYLKTLHENPFLPAFVINTLYSNPEPFLRHFKDIGLNPMLLQDQIDDEAARGLIRPFKPQHVIVNIVAMCILPFVARPIVQTIFTMDDEAYSLYLQQRENEIIGFVLNSISL